MVHIKSSIFENILSKIKKTVNTFSMFNKIFSKIINYCMPPLAKSIKQKGGNFPNRPHSILDKPFVCLFFFFFFFNLLKANYDKFTIRLNFFIIFSTFANFQENRISKAMSSKKKNLNSYFCSFKLCIKNKFMNQIVNNIKFKRNLTCILTT